jgi:hypothetical protein
VNRKGVLRILGQHGLTLERSTGRREGRVAPWPHAFDPHRAHHVVHAAQDVARIAASRDAAEDADADVPPRLVAPHLALRVQWAFGDE